MSYYTYFSLVVHNGQTVDFNAVLERLNHIHGQQSFCLTFSGDEIVSSDSMTWYDHDEDCAEMSKSFPGVVFRLRGTGSDVGDSWDAYYCNGLCQICRAKFAYPEFDPAKLKAVYDAQREDEGR